VTKQEDEQGVIVNAPSKPVIAPGKKVKKLAEKSFETERFGVLQISRKAGRYFSATILTSSVLFLCLFVYAIYSGTLILPAKPGGLNLVVWVYMGIANIVGGLLLMGSD
jgi:hypothetical protein